jgi:hypothetical protein
MVYATTELAPVLAARGIAADVSFTRVSEGARVVTLHRRSAEADLYFVSNQQPRTEQVEVEFPGIAQGARTLARGERHLGAAELSADGRSRICAVGAARGGVRGFPSKASTGRWDAPARRITPLQALTGPLPVSFEPSRGAPSSVTFEKLISWTESANPGIRYFSALVPTAVRCRCPPNGWCLDAASSSTWVM